MRVRHAAWLPVILMLAACGSEGGTRGSGITTVLGNVQSVQTAALATSPGSAPAASQVEGIRVLIDGTAFEDRTDGNGQFAIHGDFEGLATLVFQRPEEGWNVRTTINVPAAGTLTLHNVRITPQTGQVAADSEDVAFEGSIAASDCPGLTLTMVGINHSLTDSDQYTVRLDTSSIQDSQGQMLACAQVQAGDRAAVQGTVNPDESFGHAVINLEK